MLDSPGLATLQLVPLRGVADRSGRHPRESGAKAGIQYCRDIGDEPRCRGIWVARSRQVKPYEIHTFVWSLQPRSMALRDCSPCIITIGPGLP